MRPLHIALGILTAAIWGFNFVVLKVALQDVPPILLSAIRFTLSCLPVLFLAKPEGLQWRTLFIVGLGTFLGQYVFLFAAMKLGMPAGLSSVTLQLQVFITILLSVLLTGEKPAVKQLIGGLIALAGLGTIASTLGQGTTIPLLALLCIVAAAFSWAIGNVEIKRAGPSAKAGTLNAVAWMNIVPILPAFALSFVFEGPEVIYESLTTLRPITYAAIAFVIVFSTWLGFAIWGKLLSTYPASIAAPFALMVPVFGGISAWLFLGETLSPTRLVGSLVIFSGLAVILLPLDRLLKRGLA